MPLVRNVLFYIAFYGASVWFVAGAVASSCLAPARVRWFCDAWASWHIWCCARLLGIRVRFSGHRPQEQAFYAMKHESFFEAIALPWLFDFPAVFAKQELSAIPGWARASKVYGNIAVDRDRGASALRQMLRAIRPALDAGRPVVIFPEGTRVPHGSRPPLQAGFAGLYKVLDLPVVPVAVDSGSLYHRWIKRAGMITFHFGDPIPPGLLREQIEEKVWQEINRLNPETDGNTPGLTTWGKDNAADKAGTDDHPQGSRDGLPHTPADAVVRRHRRRSGAAEDLVLP